MTRRTPGALSSREREMHHLLKGKCRENENSGAAWVYKRQKSFAVTIPLHVCDENVSEKSDTSKVDPGSGGGSSDPGSMSSLCLSPVHHTTFQKREVEDSGGQVVRKGQIRRWGEEEEEREEGKKEEPSENMY